MVCYMRNRCVHRRLCEVLGLWGSLSGRLAVLVLCQQAELLPFQHEAGIAGVKENMSHHTQKRVAHVLLEKGFHTRFLQPPAPE